MSTLALIPTVWGGLIVVFFGVLETRIRMVRRHRRRGSR